MKASGQIASYLSVLAVSPRWRYGRRAGQILPFWRQRWPCFRGRPVAHDSSSHVALPFRMFVVHVVAGLAVIPVARVATGVHVLGPAQGALARVRDRYLVRGFLRLRSGRKFDDLVVRVTTVSGERRWRHFRWGRWSALLLLIHLLLLLRLYEIYIFAFRIIKMEIEEEEGKGSTYQYPVGHGPCHAQPSRWVRDGHRTPFFSSRVLRRKKCYHYSF